MPKKNIDLARRKAREKAPKKRAKQYQIVEAIINSEWLSLRGYAHRVGVCTTTLSTWLANHTAKGAPANQIAKLVRDFPGVDLSWIVIREEKLET